MTKLCLLTMFFMLTMPTSVLSAEPPNAKDFAYLDSDGDGFINRSEATQRVDLRERWNNVDRNKDGKLSSKEFSAFAEVPREPYPE